MDKVAEFFKYVWWFYTDRMYDYDASIQLLLIILSIIIIWGILAILISIITTPWRIAGRHRRKEEETKKVADFEKEVSDFENGNLKMTPDEFFKLPEKSTGRYAVKEYPENFDVTGIYILHNENNGQYYVGQSENVLKRVNQHFTGSGGNADVYADYKYGSQWTIRIVPLWNSGFKRLNALEKYGIELYEAYEKGYNKTRGNA